MAKRAIDLHRIPGTRPAAIFFFIYLYLPMVILLALSFNANRAVTIWSGFSLEWYGRVLGNSAMLIATRNSLIIAAVAAVIATVVATLAALATANTRFRGKDAVDGLIALPLVVPEIVIAVALLLFFGALSVPLGFVTVTLAHTILCIPFAYLPIRARLEGMDARLIEAAGDLYASPVRAFRRVTLPLLWPGILSGAMLCFILSFDDFVLTLFVAGAGATTLPVYIYSLIRVGVTPEVNAVSSIMLVTSIVFVSLSFFLSKKQS